MEVVLETEKVDAMILDAGTVTDVENVLNCLSVAQLLPRTWHNIHFERNEAGYDCVKDPLVHWPIHGVSLLERIIPVFHRRCVSCCHAFPIV